MYWICGCHALPLMLMPCFVSFPEHCHGMWPKMLNVQALITFTQNTNPSEEVCVQSSSSQVLISKQSITMDEAFVQISNVSAHAHIGTNRCTSQP